MQEIFTHAWVLCIDRIGFFKTLPIAHIWCSCERKRRLEWKTKANRVCDRFAGGPRAHSDPMESDRRSSFLFGRIFCDEPASTSSENALAETDHLAFERLSD